MFLALREMRRAKARFALLVASVGLLVFLILFQQTLQNGLITSFVGAIEHQSAPVLVFSVDGRRNLQGSVIAPPLEQTIRNTDGVGRAGRMGQGTFTVDTSDGLTSAAVIGYEDSRLGAPTTIAAGRLPEAEGEAVALDTSTAGFAIDDTVVVQPGGMELTVVGVATEIGYSASPTLFTDYATFEAAARAGNPDATGVLPAAIAVAPARGVTADQLVERINDASPDADALTRQDAADAAPGVAQIRQSFQIIFLLFGLVIPLVTGLFFLIITLQKAATLTLLRAIGVGGGALVRSLLAQVGIVLVAGIAVGVAVYAPLSSQRVGDIQLSFQTGPVVFWSTLLLVLGLLSALSAARRVMRIDPIEATTPAGVSR